MVVTLLKDTVVQTPLIVTTRDEPCVILLSIAAFSLWKLYARLHFLIAGIDWQGVGNLIGHYRERPRHKACRRGGGRFNSTVCSSGSLVHQKREVSDHEHHDCRSER